MSNGAMVLSLAALPLAVRCGNELDSRTGGAALSLRTWRLPLPQHDSAPLRGNAQRGSRALRRSTAACVVRLCGSLNLCKMEVLHALLTWRCGVL